MSAPAVAASCSHEPQTALAPATISFGERLRRTNFSAATTPLRARTAVIALPASAVLALRTPGILALPLSAPAVFLAAVAIATRRALTLGRAFHGVDEHG